MCHQIEASQLGQSVLVIMDGPAGCFDALRVIISSKFHPSFYAVLLLPTDFTQKQTRMFR